MSENPAFEKTENGTENVENGNINRSLNGHHNLGFLSDSTASMSSDGKFPSSFSSTEKQEKKNAVNSSTIETSLPIIINKQPKDPQLWRDLLAFWLLGLCNNYGYVVMLSAAHDIIGKFDGISKITEIISARECHLMSTGAILLADIMPALFVKMLAPFLPFWVNIRILCAILLTAAGFLLVGFAEYQWMALLGVVCISLSSGLGETTFLAYSSRFNRNVVSTWSSGTGGAGVGGSLSYAALRTAGVSTVITMVIMLFVPILECIAFWVILRKPKEAVSLFSSTTDIIEEISEKEIPSSNTHNRHEKPLETLKEKFLFILYLCKYMIPLATVYLAEYFINQGLFELVYFHNTSMDKGTQYSWLNVVYQIGVFISRSTVNLYSVEKIWLFPIFQLINVVYFLNEVIFYITPYIWIVYIIVLWEGLLGGGAYVNTFYKISKEVPLARRQFALGFVAISDSIGITLAGIISMPVHNAICGLPAPNRL